MSRAPDTSDRMTVEGYYALSEEQRADYELIDGELTYRGAPSGEHGGTIATVLAELGPFGRRAGGAAPGGWWFGTDVDIRLGKHIFRPDVAGWRRERVPERPTGMPVEVRPDWTCEVLSPANPRNDLIKKKHHYHRFEIPHYWIVDPAMGTLFVYRWSPDGYTEVVAAERGQRVRPEPFDAVEFSVGVLLGGDPED